MRDLSFDNKKLTMNNHAFGGAAFAIDIVVTGHEVDVTS